MKTCPSCNAILTVEELQAGHCEVCDSDFAPPASQAQGASQNYMQTVDASALPIELDSDEVDFASSPNVIADDRSKQTIDAVDLTSALDSGSVAVDIPTIAPEPPAERAYTQTIEAANLPAAADTDSLDTDAAPPASDRHRTVSELRANQTIDAETLPNFERAGPDEGQISSGATLDSATLPAPAVKPGTVSDVRGMQTIDSGVGPAAVQKDGTIADYKVNPTIDSTDLVGDDSGTLAERKFAQTYDSSVIADDPKKMNDMWGGKQNAGATPQMTIKGREAPPREAKESLVVQRRAFREVSEEHAYGGNADYDLVKKLGEGGMGVVYAGRQASIDRTVAIKMLKPHMAADKGQRNKFLAEAVITGDLDHPNIVPIYDLGANDEGALFYAMKCVKGTPWDKCIGEKSLSENLEILLKACDAVAFGHSRSIIHRDLKPENTMLGGFGEVLVMDWGLALPFGKFEKSRSITQSASMGGTPAYMAPEMATGPFDKMGPASDIYLLGAILYEIVTGTPPHRGKDVMKCLFAAAKNEIVPTDKKSELVDIALKAMSTKVEDRYATVQDFQAAIRSYQDHSESISMAVRATDDLQAAQKTDRYEDYSRAVFGFEEAYELWDGNKRALEGVAQAKLAYATSALKRGDFDLGASLLDRDIPAHAELAAQIDAAKREREARHQRAHQLKRVVIAMVAVGFISAVIVSGVMYSLKAMADTQRELAESAEQEARKQAGIAKTEADNARIAEGEARTAEIEAKKQEDIAKSEEHKARIAESAARTAESIARTAEVEAKKQEGIAKDEAEKAQRAAEQERFAKIEANTQRDNAKYEEYVALIGLAAAKIDENAFDRARELLLSCKPKPDEPDLRNWEWGRLMHICNQNDREYAAGAKIEAIAFAPDGKRFVTGGWNGTARVWNLDGSHLDLPHEGLYVQAVAFSPVANQVATGCDAQGAYLCIWDLDDPRRPPVHLVGHEDAITSISYSKDGKRLLTTSFDDTARIWDVETGDQLRVLAGHSWWVWDAAFSPVEPQSQVVTVSQDGTAIVWDWEKGTKSDPFTGHQGAIYSVAFARNGQTVATAGYDNRVLLWKPSDIQPFDYAGLLARKRLAPPKFDPLEGHTAAVRSVAFSPDGRLVLSAGHDNTVKVWNVEFDLSVGQDNKDVWTVASTSLLKTLRGHGSWVRACAFSPDSQWVISGGYDKSARLWNVKQYEEVRVIRGRVLKGHQDAIMAASFSSKGDRIATASRDRTAKTWDAHTGAELQEFREGHSFLASDSAFFADDKRLVTSAVDNTVRIWDVTSGVELLRLEGTGLAAAVALSHDDRWIATGSDRNDAGSDRHEIGTTTRAAKLWNAGTGELVHELNGHKVEVTAVAFSPDDRFVYSGDANGRGVLWNRETGQQLRRLDWHTSKIAAARFASNGTRLLTASDDKNVCQWDLSKLATDPNSVVPLVPLRWEHPDAVISLDLSADGTRALTACADGRLRVWDVQNDVENATPIQTFGSVSSPSSTAVFSHPRTGLPVNDQGLLVVSVHPEDRVVRIWDVATGTSLPIGNNAGSDVLLDFEKLGGLVWSARFSNDGNSLLTVGGDGARLWDMRRETPGSKVPELMTFSPHTAVASANFSPDGKRIVTASWDNSARIWNAETGADELQLHGHTGSVNSAIFSPDPVGKFILTASDDETAILWDAKQGKMIRTFQGHAGRVRDAKFSTDGARVLTASEDSTVRIFETDTANLLNELRIDEPAILNEDPSKATEVKIACLSAAFSADGRFVITGSDDNLARIWDANSQEILLELAGHTAPVTSVAFSPDGTRALTASEDFTAKLWDTAKLRDTAALAENKRGKEILNLQGHTQAVTSVTFSPNDDGRYALTGSRDGTAILWLTDEWRPASEGE